MKRAKQSSSNRDQCSTVVSGSPCKASRSARRYGGVVQHKATRGESGPTSVTEVAAHGLSGRPGPVPFRAEMEAALGTSFADVSAHTDEAALTANQAMGSKAYAVGNQIAFAGASPAKEVVAHELAHTIQQSDAPTVQTKRDGASYSSFEAEADAAAATVVSGGTATVNMRTSSSTVQRWGGSDHYMIGNLGGQKALAKIKAKNGGELPTGLETKKTEIARAGDKSKGEDEINKTSGETISMTTSGKKVGTAGKVLLGSMGVTGALLGSSGLVGTRRTGELGLGGASRIGGDYVKTPGELGKMTDGDLYESWGGMVKIASTNSNHFYPLNHSEYWSKHNAAKSLARAAAKVDSMVVKRALFNQAMILEGFACHFLQDTFAAGHHAPRALDAMTTWWENTMEAKRGLTRTKSWHDFFCMLPDGLPTSQGRFRGDYYMNGGDLETVLTRTAESVLEVASIAFGLPESPAPVLPVPDFGGIMADPVAGPVWRAMIGGGGSDLDGYGADKKKSEKRGASYTTSGGVTVSNSGVLDPMKENIFGEGKSKEGAKGTKENVAKSLRAIKHMVDADFHANVHTREDDAVKDKPKKRGDARFSAVELETKFGMYSALLDLAEKWLAGLESDSPDRSAARYVVAVAKKWKSEARKIVWHAGVKNVAVTTMVKSEVQKALAKL